MFSNSAKYAIRTVLFLAREEDVEKKFKVGEIAAELNIPSPYLSKILQQLSKNNLVTSVKGPKGGFYLSEENRKNTLLDIVLCIEGHNVFEKCVLGLAECSSENPCHLHEYFYRFKMDLQRVIREVTIGDSYS